MSANLDKLMIGHGGTNVNQIMLLTKDTNAIWRKKKVIFYYADELSVTSSVSTQSR